MLRRIAKISRRVLLGLLIAAGGLWGTLGIWSYTSELTWGVTGNGPHPNFQPVACQFVRGRFYACWSWASGFVVSRTTFWEYRLGPFLFQRTYSPVRAERRRLADAASLGMLIIRTPFWAPLLGLAIVPANTLFVVPLRRRHRRKRNLCVGCGYNLWGNMSGRCPECGRTI